MNDKMMREKMDHKFYTRWTPDGKLVVITNKPKSIITKQDTEQESWPSRRYWIGLGRRNQKRDG